MKRAQMDGSGYLFQGRLLLEIIPDEMWEELEDMIRKTKGS